GAYLSTFASCIPTILYATLLAGQYTTPVIYCEVTAVFTNTTPVDAYRGAGRPEATYVIERLVETAARELKLDPVEIRRRNFIKTFPYQTPVALCYDTGNYEATLSAALDLADVGGFQKRKEESLKRGKLRGIGYACYIEACGIAPSNVAGSLGARAEAPGDVRRRDAAGLDVARVTDAAQFSPLQGLFLAFLKAADVREIERRAQRRLVIARVVAQRDRRLVGESLDEVAPPDLDRVELELARRGFHQPLDHVGGLGPAGAAVGVDRRGVGECRGDLAVDDRRGVLAREQRRVEDRRDARGEGREIRAEVGIGAHAHRKKLAVLVERELRDGDVVAPVGVGQKGLAAVGGPLHRPVELLRRPGDHHVLG